MAKHNVVGNNNKHKGENAVKFVIAELARWNIEVALPMSDNLPFDLVAVYKKKLFKVQVKSSSKSGGRHKSPLDAISFSLRTSNWWKGENTSYTRDDADVFIAYDLLDNRTYLFGPEHFVGKNSIVIRKTPAINNQKGKCKFAEDFVISQNRIDSVFK